MRKARSHSVRAVYCITSTQGDTHPAFRRFISYVGESLIEMHLETAERFVFGTASM